MQLFDESQSSSFWQEGCRVVLNLEQNVAHEKKNCQTDKDKQKSIGTSAWRQNLTNVTWKM